MTERASALDTSKVKYRVVEHLPNVYRVQRRGILWGWNDCGWDYGPLDYPTAAEAEALIRKWLADEAHVLRVVKEFP